MLNKIDLKGNEAQIHAVVYERNGIPIASYLYKNRESAVIRFDMSSDSASDDTTIRLYTVGLLWTEMACTNPPPQEDEL